MSNSCAGICVNRKTLYDAELYLGLVDVDVDVDVDVGVDLDVEVDALVSMDSSMIFSLGMSSKEEEDDELDEDSDYSPDSPSTGTNSPLSFENGQDVFVPLYDLPFTNVEKGYLGRNSKRFEKFPGSVLIDQGYTLRDFEHDYLDTKNDVIYVNPETKQEQEQEHENEQEHVHEHGMILTNDVYHDSEDPCDDALKLVTNDADAVYLNSNNITDVSPLYKMRFLHSHPHSTDDHLLGIGIEALSSVSTPARVDSPVDTHAHVECTRQERYTNSDQNGHVENFEHIANSVNNGPVHKTSTQDRNPVNVEKEQLRKRIAKRKGIAKYEKKPRTKKVTLDKISHKLQQDTADFVKKDSEESTAMETETTQIEQGLVFNCEGASPTDGTVHDDLEACDAHVTDNEVDDQDYSDRLSLKKPKKKRGMYKRNGRKSNVTTNGCSKDCDHPHSHAHVTEASEIQMEKKCVKKRKRGRPRTKGKVDSKRKSNFNDNCEIATDYSGQEKFICKTCGKDFPRKSNHDSHIRLHLTIKPHVCKFCSKAFVRRSDMNRHERSLHLKTTFRCQGQNGNGEKWGCGRLYSRKDGLRKHWKSTPGHHCLRSFLEVSRLSDKLKILDGIEMKANSERELESIIDLTRLC